MRYGFYLPTRGLTATPAALETLLARGEALGFASVMVSDHIVFPERIDSKYPVGQYHDRVGLNIEMVHKKVVKKA